VQAYRAEFARVYNARWGGYVAQVAPLLHEFYSTISSDSPNKTLLDLCCGTGQLAAYFLKEGYRVVGLDLSEHMLRFAEENTRSYIEAGSARFIKADAADFAVDERFGLVVSTYDSLNHLANEEALTGCFRCVRGICDGWFIFDLNTRRGLKQWNNINVHDGKDDTLIITRGVYDGQGDRAWTTITGFVKDSDGRFRRFDETVYNTAFDMMRVRQALYDTGWENIYFARMQALSIPLADPEQEGRVFVIAR